MNNCKSLKLDLGAKDRHGRTGFDIAKLHDYYAAVHLIESKIQALLTNNGYFSCMCRICQDIAWNSNLQNVSEAE